MFGFVSFPLGCVGYAELFRVQYSHKIEHPTRDVFILFPPEIAGVFLFCMAQRHGDLWLYVRAGSGAFVLMLQNLQINLLQIVVL